MPRGHPQPHALPASANPKQLHLKDIFTRKTQRVIYAAFAKKHGAGKEPQTGYRLGNITTLTLADFHGIRDAGTGTLAEIARVLAHYNMSLNTSS